MEEAQQPNVDTNTSVFKRPADMPPNDANAKRPRSVKSTKRRRMRKILRIYNRKMLRRNLKLSETLHDTINNLINLDSE